MHPVNSGGVGIPAYCGTLLVTLASKKVEDTINLHVADTAGLEHLGTHFYRMPREYEAQQGQAGPGRPSYIGSCA